MSRAQSDALALPASTRPTGNVRLVARNVVSAWMHFWKTRTALRQLSEMSESHLADIGLTRCDVDTVVLRSSKVRATRELQSIAHERARSMVLNNRNL
ncbi:DUF1127 domain-containing protein [Nitratireductor indicus]|uniref:YjiS-like domain-containing protein n=1 Tax=Nitratireductor indicus C115 TaxID=1231190 RepID=K2P0L9_9HYPH|nr:DUF1127 domain-containing protein [Nitratireductor indicus]EKF40886.1 hypothetical protein NA8A_18382 [Nitratireductor indicus C115]MDS1138628.1 DUF1127 domain-containing protein [Nitratireductor indicus]SFQ33132.1 protein of unknown function [Nitratireductor indicus]